MAIFVGLWPVLCASCVLWYASNRIIYLLEQLIIIKEHLNNVQVAVIQLQKYRLDND